MGQPRLKFGDSELPLKPGITSVGRTPDNDVSFPQDSNVSRFHAEIEMRGPGEYWLTDTGSSNGTTLNGRPVLGDVPLEDGDKILLGGSSELTFMIEDENAVTKDEPAMDTGPEFATPSVSVAEVGSLGSVGSGLVAQETAVASGSNAGMLIAGAGVCCLVLVLAVGGVAYYLTSKPKCEAKAKIVRPESGDTLINETEVEIDVDNSSCVGRAVFLIDGVEFASTDEPPFNVAIDPKEMPDLADGFDHSLTVVLQDEKGGAISQPPPVLLAFESREVTKPPEKEVVAQNTQVPTTQQGRQVSLIDVQQMSIALVKKFSGNYSYNVSNREFLREVQKRTGEYAQEGYFERASRYRDAVNVAYVREQNLDAPLGFILAMSRSRFDPKKNGDNEGLWQMSTAFVTANAYNGLCGTETLSDPSQNCAAKASALYMKAIVFGVFGGDAIYSAAAFGKSPQEAAAWNATLPAKRADIWNTIKTAPEREAIVRFFAAGIVAENPQKFGLKRDRPLSELYRLTL